MAEPKLTHADGSPCPEGTQAIPRGFGACCTSFDQHTKACYFDIRYEWWPKYRGWFICIAPDAGGGGIAISFCPHCGVKLSGSSRTASARTKTVSAV